MAAQPVPRPPRAKLIHRRAPDRSQRLRRSVQGVFLALNLWIGIEFYFFVRYYESGGATGWSHRPPGVEGWLPIAALMNLKAFLITGHIPIVHPAGMFLLIAFLSISLLFRKAFCGWLCPVGTISEVLGAIGRRWLHAEVRLPRWADIALRAPKYGLLAMFGFAVASMSAEAIEAFLGGSYGLIADVKMLNFFRTLSTAGIVIMALLALASVFIQNFWCRYLCPYGALMGLVALVSPARIRRNQASCIDCARCATACPSRLPVDRLVNVRSAECMACMACVAACPSEDALGFAIASKRSKPAWILAASIIAVFAGVAAYAQWSGHWHTVIDHRVYFDLIPHADEFSHP